MQPAKHSFKLNLYYFYRDNYMSNNKSITILIGFIAITLAGCNNSGISNSNKSHTNVKPDLKRDQLAY